MGHVEGRPVVVEVKKMCYAIHMNPQVAEVQKKTTHILREYGATYAGVFGSVARGEAREDSDVDMVVDLGRPMGLVRYIQFTEALKKALNREVDVVGSNMHPVLRRRAERPSIYLWTRTLMKSSEMN
jgi:uncharacterized protein